MKNQLLLLLAFVAGFSVVAQENLIPNSDFENADVKRLKDYGMMEEYAVDWFSATKAPADLFSNMCKSEKVAIPRNLYGKENARSGANYAGFRAYSKTSKKTRTYISVKLSDGLEKNQLYCVKFNVSLADLSKYGVNYVGAAFSDRKIIQPNTGTMVRSAEIMKKNNPSIVTMDGWETICGSYVGTGVEEYLIIGCFERDEKLDLTKVKKPKDVTGSPLYEAYYYLDDVEVYPIDANSQCACSRADELEPDLIYSKAVVVEDDMTPADILKINTVYYAFLKSGINSMAERDLTTVIQLLKANPGLNIDLIGHCDQDEFNEGKITARYRGLGASRADGLKAYLVSKGVDGSRISVQSQENNSPANTRPTPLSKAQNRRVELRAK